MSGLPGAEDSGLSIDCARAVLDNGLVVLIHEDHNAPHVSLSVCYRVGSKDEGPGQTGSAHLFEHLMFTGSANLPGLFSTTLTEAGAVMVNAYTTPDFTCFFEIVPPNMLAYALFAEADRMGSFREHLTEAAVAQQRDIVLEEKAQRAGGVLGTLPEIVRANLYPIGHPYHHPVIGSVPDIAGMTLERAREWHARFYTPDNAVIVIGGPVDRVAALDLVRRHFSHIPPSGQDGTTQQWIPAPIVRRRTQLDAAVPHGGLVELVWPVAEASDPDVLALELVAGVLAGDETSPLYRALVRQGQCLAVSAAVSPGMVCSEFAVTLTLDTGADHRSMASAAREAISAALSDPLHDAAFDRIRARNRARLALSLEHLATAVGVLMNGEMLWRDPQRYIAEINSIERLTPDDLREIGLRWLCAEPLAVEVHLRHVPPFVPTDRPPIPAVEQTSHEGLAPQFEQTDHPNGLRTIFVPRPESRDFVLRLDLAHGSDAERADERGIGLLVSTMPYHGIGALDPAGVRELTDRSGINLHLALTPSAFVIEMHGPAAAAESAAILLNDMVLSPRFDDAVTAERKRDQANQLRAAQPDPMAGFDAILPGRLYGNDSVEARDPGGTIDSIAAVTADSLRAHHLRLFDPAGATLFASGSAETLRKLDDCLTLLRAHWKSPVDPLLPEAAHPLPPRHDERLFFVAAGPSDQAIVRMALLLPTPTDLADEAAGRALAFVQERRLSTLLRDERRWTYGISARAIEAVTPDLPPRLEVGGAVNADRAVDVIAEIERALTDIVENAPPTATEIAGYVAAARAGITGSLATTGGRVAAVAMAVRKPRPADVRARLDALDRLDPARIVALARDARAIGPAEWAIASTAQGMSDALRDTGRLVTLWPSA